MSRVTGITLDTGALIALERRNPRMRAVYLRALDLELQLTAPTAVIAEWWHGRTDAREKLFASLYVEPLTGKIAKAAGEALAAVRRATLADAIVMASAALRGDVVYTSDVADLEALRTHFPSVRVLNV